MNPEWHALAASLDEVGAELATFAAGQDTDLAAALRDLAEQQHRVAAMMRHPAGKAR